MGQLALKQYKEILERMQNRVVARTDLTDLTETSSVKQVLAAAAREADDINYQVRNALDLTDLDRSIGPDLDERAKEYNSDLISRAQPRVATGQVVFSRTGTVGALTIPAGVEVQVPATGAQSPIKFTTTEEGAIADTFQNSGSVDVIAQDTGTRFNVDPNTVTAFGAKPPGVDSVTNPAGFGNGADLESDDNFRRRIRAFVKSLARSTPSALLFAAFLAEDVGSGKRVVFARVVEDKFNPGNVIVYIDDGSGTAEGVPVLVATETLIASAVGGEVEFTTANKPIKKESGYTVKHDPAGAPPQVSLAEGVDYSLDPASGQVKLLPANFPSGLGAGDNLVIEPYTYFDGLIQQAQLIIDGAPSNRTTYPGYRAAGVLVRVLAPNVRQLTFQANVTVLAGFSQFDVAAKVTAAVDGYINGLSIGENVILNELRERAMAVPGMFDMIVLAPTTNTVILDTELARILSGNILIS